MLSKSDCQTVDLISMHAIQVLRVHHEEQIVENHIEETIVRRDISS